MGEWYGDGLRIQGRDLPSVQDFLDQMTDHLVLTLLFSSSPRPRPKLSGVLILKPQLVFYYPRCFLCISQPDVETIQLIRANYQPHIESTDYVWFQDNGDINHVSGRAAVFSTWL